MKKRSEELRFLWKPAVVIMSFWLIMDVLEYWRDMRVIGAAQPDLKHVIFCIHLREWLMYGVIIVWCLFSLIFQNWPKETRNRGSAALFSGLCLGWAATALIPDFVFHSGAFWWIGAVALLLGAAYSWWKSAKYKKETVSSS